MKVTDVRVKLIPERGDRLQAFCTITLDDSFVIRDLKVIGGARGVFVAMPSRKLADRCGQCGGKNHLRAAFCNDCGKKLADDRASRDEHGRVKLHADIAHPINSATRETVQKVVVDAFRAEVARSKEPGYVPQKLYDDEDYAEDYEDAPALPARADGAPRSEPKPVARASGRQSPRRAAPAAASPSPPPADPPAEGPLDAPPMSPGTGTGPDDFTTGIFG